MASIMSIIINNVVMNANNNYGVTIMAKWRINNQY